MRATDFVSAAGEVIAGMDGIEGACRVDGLETASGLPGVVAAGAAVFVAPRTGTLRRKAGKDGRPFAAGFVAPGVVLVADAAGLGAFV